MGDSSEKLKTVAIIIIIIIIIEWLGLAQPP